MALSARLELRQRQALIVTPQLQQAIKLLQLSNLDLQAYVERELEQNPFLEREAENAPPAPGETPAQDGPERPDLAEALSKNLVAAENVDPDYADAGDDAPRDSGWADMQRRAGSADFNDVADYAELLAEQPCLADHLSAQLFLATADAQLRLIGGYLIDAIDEAGYLRCDLAAAAAHLGADLDQAERALAIIQGCEPAGVGARDLAECLRLQLIDKNRYDPVIAAVIDHLDLVAAQDVARLRRATGLSVEDLDDAFAELRRLNPKPGLKFAVGRSDAVIPDIFVKRRKGGGWLVEINQDTLPRLLVNRSYFAAVCGAARTDVDKSYLSSSIASANWLVRSLDQRSRTILKVAQEIVAQQDAFLVHGVRYLKPLNLRDVADNIGMHESTVSRVTSNKYIATPRGLFELKYFFTSAIAGASRGEQHSSESVRHRIRQLIEEEAPEEVLSDDQIVSMLRKEGMDIARRTVAKYREALRIPSSVQRRRQKRLMLARTF